MVELLSVKHFPDVDKLQSASNKLDTLLCFQFAYFSPKSIYGSYANAARS